MDWIKCSERLPHGNRASQEYLIRISFDKYVSHEVAFDNECDKLYPIGWWRLDDNLDPYTVPGVEAWIKIED